MICRRDHRSEHSIVNSEGLSKPPKHYVFVLNLHGFWNDWHGENAGGGGPAFFEVSEVGCEMAVDLENNVRAAGGDAVLVPLFQVDELHQLFWRRKLRDGLLSVFIDDNFLAASGERVSW